MNEPQLLRHLPVVVLIKLVVIAALWWSFVRDARVPVDAQAAASHLIAPAATTAASPEGAR